MMDQYLWVAAMLFMMFISKGEMQELKFKVNTVGGFGCVHHSFQLKITYPAVQQHSYYSTTTNIEYSQLNQLIVMDVDMANVIFGRPFNLQWSTNPVYSTSAASSCCWHVSDTQFVIDTQNYLLDIDLCSSGNVQKHNCSGNVWTCTHITSSNPSPVPVAATSSNTYTITNDSFVDIQSVSNCLNGGDMFDHESNTPSDFPCAVESQSLLPSSMNTLATESMPLLTASKLEFTSTTHTLTSTLPLQTSTVSLIPTSSSDVSMFTPSSSELSTSLPSTISSSISIGSSSVLVVLSTTKSLSQSVFTSSNGILKSSTNAKTMNTVIDSSTLLTFNSNLQTLMPTTVMNSQQTNNIISTTTLSSMIKPTPLLTRNECEEDGVWNATLPDTNVTIDNACYSESVSGTRRCNKDGSWDDVYCIVPVQFTEILTEIQADPAGGLQLILDSVNSSSQTVADSLPVLQYLYLLDTVGNVLLVRNVLISAESSMIVLNIASKIAAILLAPDNRFDKESQRLQASRLLSLLDDIALTVIRPTRNVLFGTSSPIIALTVLEIDSVPLEDVITIQVGQDSISIPREYFDPINQSESPITIRVASFHYQDISSLLPPRNPDSTIASSIISATTNCTPCSAVKPLDRNVTVQLQVKRLPQANEIVECVFFQFEYSNIHPTIPIGGHWNTSGCTTTVNGDIVTCSCNHLTHFAILLSPGGGSAEISATHYKILNTMGLVLVPISLVCMVLVILTYTLIRSLWNIRNYIHIMLCASLFMAQLVFIIGVDKIGNQKACSFVAVLLLYLFLVTFMWMLMEGVVLYVTLVRVIITNHKYYMIAFTAASYVIPAVYLALVVPIGYTVNTSDIPDQTHFLYYRNEEDTSILTACWLNYSTGFVWSFIVPVILIIMVNVGFFIMAVVIAKKHSTKKLAKGAEFRHWLQVTISLTVVMGIAWVVGLLAFRRELLPVVYIITIFIAAQGIILFIILVPVSQQVRKAYMKIWMKNRKAFVSKLPASIFFTSSSVLPESKMNSLKPKSSMPDGTMSPTSTMEKGSASDTPATLMGQTPTTTKNTLATDSIPPMTNGGGMVIVNPIQEMSNIN